MPAFKNAATVFALLTFLCLGALFYLYVDGYFARDARVSRADGTTLVLRAARDGHFYADGTINGYAVRFMVDTGATSVALSERLAREIGLPFGAKTQGSTANGMTEQWLTRIEAVEIGGVRVEDVRAAILPNMDDEVLLGMSFLRHFDWQQRGGELQLLTK